MGDRSWAKITIGGIVPGLKFRQFCDNVLGYDPLALANMGEGDAVVRIDQDGRLVIEDAERAGGWFEELENWLVSNGIPFDRVNDGYGGSYGPELRQWRPGMDQPLDLPLALDEPCVLLDEVRRHLDPPGEFRAWFERAHPVFPPVPPLQVVGDLPRR